MIVKYHNRNAIYPFIIFIKRFVTPIYNYEKTDIWSGTSWIVVTYGISDYFNFSKCSLNIDVIIESYKGNNSKDYNLFIRKNEWTFCYLDNLDEYIWTNTRIIQQLRQRIPSEFVKDVPQEWHSNVISSHFRKEIVYPLLKRRFSW